MDGLARGLTRSTRRGSNAFVSDKPTHNDPRARREAELAKALRANLHRRKALGETGTGEAGSDAAGEHGADKEGEQGDAPLPRPRDGG